jgi:hypothetical protein
MNTDLQNFLWYFMGNLLQMVCLVLCQMLNEQSVAIFANIIDAAEHKVKCLQHGDSV